MDPLDTIRRFVLQERNLFGDTLLASNDTPSTAGQSKPMTVSPSASHKAGGADPELFPAGAPAVSSSEPWRGATSLDELNGMICRCRKCELWQTRTNFVFGVGNPKATFMVVGEAPGADEDAQGEPFVGRAGQLLNKILEAIGFKRGDVYIANVLKSRPPNNRRPTPEESEACKPYLIKQIELIKPRVILCVGLTAAQNLLQVNETMARLRGGRIFEYAGIPLMVTYHPAALLRNPNWKRPTWEDVQAARVLHDKILAEEKKTA